MDIKIDDSDGQFLEYNTLGGIVDLYFLAGPTPKEVAVQYSALSGTAAMMPYWGFGFHQCKYGYRDVWEVAEVVANYTQADINLEVMWTDIDYMELRRLFTLDPERYPLELVRDMVSHLHERQQHYILMVNSAVWAGDNDVYNEGVEQNVWQVRENGSEYRGEAIPWHLQTCSDLMLTIVQVPSGLAQLSSPTGSIPTLRTTGIVSLSSSSTLLQVSILTDSGTI